MSWQKAWAKVTKKTEVVPDKKALNSKSAFFVSR